MIKSSSALNMCFKIRAFCCGSFVSLYFVLVSQYKEYSTYFPKSS